MQFEIDYILIETTNFDNINFMLNNSNYIL